MATGRLVARWHNRNGRQWVELYRDWNGFWYSTHEKMRPLCGDDGDEYAVEKCEQSVVPHAIDGKAYRERVTA